MTRVLYTILAYKLPDQVQRLVGRLMQAPESYVLLHEDPTHPPSGVRPSDRVFVFDDPIPIRWGDSSLVTAILRCLDWAASPVGPQFDWLLLLSAQDHPAMPPADIASILGSTRVDALVHAELIRRRASDNPTRWTRGLSRRYFYRRVRFGHLPRRHPFSEQFPCWGGSVWLNLSAAAVDAIVAHPRRAELERYFAPTQLPDETLLHTLLCNSSVRVDRDAPRRFIKWSGGGHPDLLTVADVPRIRTSGAFFARKFDESVHPGVLDALDEALDPPNGQRAPNTDG